MTELRVERLHGAPSRSLREPSRLALGSEKIWHPVQRIRPAARGEDPPFPFCSTAAADHVAGVRRGARGRPAAALALTAAGVDGRTVTVRLARGHSTLARLPGVHVPASASRARCYRRFLAPSLREVPHVLRPFSSTVGKADGLLADGDRARLAPRAKHRSSSAVH